MSSTMQPASPAADDNSPDLQEHTKLAEKRLQLAAGVNILPYAPVGASTQLIYPQLHTQKGKKSSYLALQCIC